MEQLILVPVNPKYKDQVLAYKSDFINRNESMDGSAGLIKSTSFEEWLTHLDKNSNQATVKPGLVPSTTLLAVTENDHRLVGMLDLRHYLNDNLLQTGGHIGYSVLYSERQKGFASQMLGLALNLCTERGIKRILLTCNKDNVASAKTILKNGGQLENEVLEDTGRIVQRFWISLK